MRCKYNYITRCRMDLNGVFCAFFCKRQFEYKALELLSVSISLIGLYQAYSLLKLTKQIARLLLKTLVATKTATQRANIFIVLQVLNSKSLKPQHVKLTFCQISILCISGQRKEHCSTPRA